MRRRVEAEYEDRETFSPWEVYSDLYCGLLLVFVLLFFFAIYQYIDARETNNADTKQLQADMKEEQEAVLALYKADLEAQEAAYQEKSRTLEDRNTALTQMQARLDERESELTHNNELLAENEEKLQTQEEALALKETELQAQKMLLAQKETELESQGDLLTQKESELEAQGGLLRERESELARQQEKITEQEAKLEEQAAILKEQKTQLEEQTATLNEQKTQLEEQTATLNEQRTQLEEQTATLAEQQTQLKEQAVTLTEQSGMLEEQKILLAEKETELDARDQALAERDTELEKRGTELTLLQEQIARQERQLKAQQEAIDTQAEQIEQIVGVRGELIEELRSRMNENGIQVEVDPDTGAIAFQSEILFELNSSELKEEGKEFFRTFMPVYLSALLQPEFTEYVAEIIIEGHTDSAGNYLHNLELSQQRAYSVAQFIMAGEEGFLDENTRGMLRSMLTVNGCADRTPVYREDGSVDADKSRRVEIKFSLTDQEMIREMDRILNTGSTQE